MLGIRHYKGVAIDLFLGKPEDFCSDAFIMLSQDSNPSPTASKIPARQLLTAQVSEAGFVEDSEVKSTLAECLANLTSDRDQHVTFSGWETLERCHIPLSYESFCRASRSYIDEIPQGKIRRCTFIFAQQSSYDRCRIGLTKVFPST